MSYQGSYGVGDSIYWNFDTTVGGVPTVFAGSPALTVYKNNSLTQSATGLTLTVSWDGVVGQNHVKIDTSADSTFYDAGSQFSVQISAGTVGGNSVVGRGVGSFSLEAEVLDSVTGSTGFVVGSVGGTVEGVTNGRPRALTPGTRS